MIPVKHIDPDDLALYAMQLLTPEETAELHEQLEHSGEARRVLSDIFGDLSVLAHSVEPQSPIEDARQRLMKQVASEKKTVAIDRQEEGAYVARGEGRGTEAEVAPRSAASRILPWLGWAVAAGMMVEAGNLYLQREQMRGTIATDRTQLAQMQDTIATDRTQLAQTQVSAELAQTLMDTMKDPAAVHVTLTSSAVKPPPEGRASYIVDKGSLIFLASNLAPLQAYKTYELWLIPADGRDPIAAGTFRPDERGNASVVLPPLPKGVAAKAFGVTIENGDGSSAPTLPILLKGAAS